MLENHPLYIEKNPIRYDQFLIDLNDLLTKKIDKCTTTEAVAYLLNKYELKNANLFNRDACNFLIYVVLNYAKKYLELLKDNKIISSSTSDLSLLRNS